MFSYLCGVIPSVRVIISIDSGPSVEVFFESVGETGAVACYFSWNHADIEVYGMFFRHIFIDADDEGACQ